LAYCTPKKITTTRKPATFLDYETYLSGDIYDVGKVDDPNSFREAVSCENSAKWFEAMEEELKYGRTA
jgi:hypothetical protein